MHVFLKMSTQEVSRLMLVSTRTVQRYCHKFMATGDLEPQQHRNGPQRILTDFEELILVNLVLTRPGIYLYELQRELLMTTGTEVDCSTICRLFKRLGITRQKIKRIALQRTEEKRGAFMAEMMMYDSSTLLWVDDTGCDRRKLVRDYGYGIRGILPEITLSSSLENATIAAMSNDGVEDIYIQEGNVNGAVFLDFIRRCLIPVLMPFNGHNPKSIVIMDNACFCSQRCKVAGTDQ